MATDAEGREGDDRVNEERDTMVDDPIHLATGIICGGDKLWCGAVMVTEYREETGKVHVLNATDKFEKATCSICIAKYAEAMAMERVKKL